MSSITVSNLQGHTSGADANKVKLASGQTLDVNGTLDVTGATFTGEVVQTANIADDAITAAKIADAARSAGAFKVKQIVSNKIHTALEVGSSATPDWSQGETTITPTSNTNPILVQIHTYSKSTSSGTQGAAKIRRKTNSGSFGDVGGELRIFNESGSTVKSDSHIIFNRWDNPTRSAGDSLTYTLTLRRTGGSDSVWLWGSADLPASITLIEFEGTTETDGA